MVASSSSSLASHTGVAFKRVTLWGNLPSCLASSLTCCLDTPRIAAASAMPASGCSLIGNSALIAIDAIATMSSGVTVSPR